MTTPKAQTAYDELANRFESRNPKSKSIYVAATQALPGGNTRSVLFYHPFPLSIKTAQGSRIKDADGHEYIDLLGEYTAGLYGHSEPVIIEPITEAAKRGLNFGGHHEEEVKLASLVKKRFPSMDLLRFTNSGTEATLMCLSAAKAYTGKDKILVFDGAYHGGAFTFKSGKSSPVNAPHEYLIAKYNNIKSVHRLLRHRENRGRVAAVLVEPMLGSGGAIAGERSFIEGLREAADTAAAVLIFDEVMTSRMHAGGGIQSQLREDLRPDMTTLGKYIGGGMSFGAFGGKRSIMAQFDPRKANALSHAGTFNNNVLTMSAGLAGLEKVFTSERAKELHIRGEELRRSLQAISRGTLMKVTGYGSIMCFHFTRTEIDGIRSPEDLKCDDRTLGDLFHLSMLEQGFYLASRGFIALSLPLTEDELKAFEDAVKQFLKEYSHLLSIGELDKTKARL